MNVSSDILITIAIIAIIVFFIIGLMKKTLWMCVVAAIIAGICFFTQPDRLESFKNTVTSVFDGGVEPLKDTRYDDIVNEME